MNELVMRVRLWRQRRSAPPELCARLVALHEEYLQCIHEGPEFFPLDLEKRGEVVGSPIEVKHPLSDAWPLYACLYQMTDLVFRYGLVANAYRIVGFEHLGDMVGETLIQPVWIPRDTAEDQWAA